MKKLAILSLTLFFAINLFGFGEEILTVETKTATDAVLADGDFSFAVMVNIKHPWHINSWKPLDEFSIPTVLSLDQSDNYEIQEIIYPQHKLIELSISDQPAALYEGEITILVKGKLTEKAVNILNISGTFRYQGCNNTSCLPPEEAAVIMTLPIVTDPKAIHPINNQIFNQSSLTEVSEITQDNITPQGPETFDVSASFAQKGIIFTYFLILLGGLGLVLTPCVYPLIPITMSYFGGQASDSKGKTIFLALIYVLGMALVNSAIGTIAALSGGLLGSFMTNPVVLIFIAGVLIALALSMFGFYEFGLPSFLTNLGGNSKKGYFGALLMGMTMGIVAAPCIGPFVIGLLTYVASTGNPFIGFSMFFTLSAGLGIPFIFLAFFSGKITSLPKAGEWMVGIRTIFGLILLGMALYFLHPIIPNTIFLFLLPAFLILSGIYLLIFNKVGDNTRGFSMLKKILAVFTIFAAGYFAKSDAPAPQETMNWIKFSQEYYDTAIADEKPVMIDFFADWCIPCKELDKFTFTDKKIIELSRKFHLIKADLTGNVDGDLKALRDKYHIKGVPTIVFIDKQGSELINHRTLGFVKAEEFIIKMQETHNR
ncbi:MAG: thioredoxin family protein [Candidatus Marinimicrobia bacterium]|nr:thioredoxin family protein [Candidatus Neomarinimicrobiota bacterium]